LTEAYWTNELTGKLGTHAMRKTFATKVYTRLQHDLVKTQRALGHRNINSTVAYLSFCEDDVMQAILAP
jgi:integrase